MEWRTAFILHEPAFAHDGIMHACRSPRSLLGQGARTIRPRCISRSGCLVALSSLSRAQNRVVNDSLARYNESSITRVPRRFSLMGEMRAARVGEACWALEKVASEVGMGRDSGVTASDSLGKLWGCRRDGQRGRCAPINIGPVTPGANTVDLAQPLARTDGRKI